MGSDVYPHKHHRASRRGGRPTQEAVMGKAIPAQHPAVVLRSHYQQLRRLLAIAMIAVVGLTAAVVILATNDEGATNASSARPLNAPSQAAPGIRYDGGPEEGTSAIQPWSAATRGPSGIRYDGGPEEGTSAIQPSSAATGGPSGIRYDGGPEEGTSAIQPSSAATRGPSGIRYDGGPEEGTSAIQPSSAATRGP